MRYRFGQFELDTLSGILIGRDGPVSLRRQTFRLLEVLLNNAPNLVDRDTLLDEAWGRTALSANVVPQAISELRQALGDSASQPRYIETLHRRGYRMLPDVERIESPEPAVRTVVPQNRNQLWIALAVLSPLALALAWWMQGADQRWLEDDMLPAIERKVETDVTDGWRLAREARKRVDDDPRLEQLWLDLTLPVELSSQPDGARVEVSGYGDVPADWVPLGTTPLGTQRLPLSAMKFRVSRPGYRTIELAPSVLPRPEPFFLHEDDTAPKDMVFVSAGPVRYRSEQHDLAAFWIDRHEVSNADYMKFIEDGGYRNPDLWPEQVEIDGTTLNRDQLLERLVDATGLPGPSSWALGAFPEGKGDHPVEGLSWYEADAYARWAGKQLPTVFHWHRAAGLGTRQAPLFSGILSLSNFSRAGTVPVGSSGGLGPYGSHDMAGNVREWCRNSAGDLRYAMGGAWNDNSYQFSDWVAYDPLDRSEGFGFRLVRQEAPVDQALAADIQFLPQNSQVPVDDETFEIFSRLYDYDETPLNAETVRIDDSHQAWRRERVAFDAAYGNERVTAQLFLPRGSSPPYQTIVHLPGGDALMQRDSREAGLLHVEPFLRTGRAVVYPVYKGTFERPAGAAGPVGVRDLLVQQVKDLRRTIDYLATREDIDMNRLALHGVSWGASRSMFALAVEPRFSTAMLVSTGLSPTDHLPPEIQQVDYLARVRIPVLLVTGRNDFTFPYESSQRPLFNMLGTPEDQKRHIAVDWGHLPPGYTELSRHLIQWSDQTLGPVGLQASGNSGNP